MYELIEKFPKYAPDVIKEMFRLSFVIEENYKKLNEKLQIR